jgi:hypothetical protein
MIFLDQRETLSSGFYFLRYTNSFSTNSLFPLLNKMKKPAPSLRRKLAFALTFTQDQDLLLHLLRMKKRVLHIYREYLSYIEALGAPIQHGDARALRLLHQN